MTEQQLTFPVYGMNCATCASKLTAAFNALNGVDANVNLALEKATLTFQDSEHTSSIATDVMAILQQKGYQTDYQTLTFDADWSCASCVEGTLKGIKTHPFVLDAKANLVTQTLYVDTFASAINAQMVQELIALSPKKLEQKAAITSQQQQQNKQQAALQKKQREQRQLILTLLLSAPFWFAMISMFFTNERWLSPWVQFALATPLQFIMGARFYTGAWRSIKGRAANMDLLVVLGTSAAYFFSLYMLLTGQLEHLYFESSSLVITLIRLGKYLEFRAKQSSSKAITALSQLQATHALVKKGKVFQKVAIEQVQANDLVQLAMGDKTPVDGVVVEGESYLDEALLTGESDPIYKKVDDTVFAGSINGDGALLIRATAVNEQTKLHGIIELVESAQMSKAPILALVDKISAYFVPAVLGIALLTFISWFYLSQDLEQALIYSVAVLVIACPCALGLATPTAMVVGTGLAAQKGILIKDINTLQLAHQLDCIVFDKTGTLTKGKVSIKHMESLQPDFVPLLLGLQQSSKHPIAKAVMQYHDPQIASAYQVQAVKNIHGQGLQGMYQGSPVVVGNTQLLESVGIDLKQQLQTHALHIDSAENTLYLGYQGQLMGYFSIQDELRPESQEAITTLQNLGLSTVLLSGDKQTVVEAMAEKLGFTVFYAQQTPAQKLQQIAQLQQKQLLAMVGDGVNDAPALAAADVSIAMGSGSDAAKQTASMTLMRDDPRLIAAAIKLSRHTWRTIQQNLFWAFIFNSLAIPAAAFGYLTPTIAAMAMTASSLIVLSNSLLLKRHH